jgi:transcriptional regulator with XRE-family HTH domain
LARTSNFADVIRKELAQAPALAEAVEDAVFGARIAEEIYAARNAAGLTQAQLAKQIGTQQSVIARLEDADYSGHSLNLLRRIAGALGLTVRVQFCRKLVKPPEQIDQVSQEFTVECEGWPSVEYDVAGFDNDVEFEELETYDCPVAEETSK